MNEKQEMTLEGFGCSLGAVAAVDLLGEDFSNS